MHLPSTFLLVGAWLTAIASAIPIAAAAPAIQARSAGPPLYTVAALYLLDDETKLKSKREDSSEIYAKFTEQAIEKREIEEQDKAKRDELYLLGTNNVDEE